MEPTGKNRGNILSLDGTNPIDAALQSVPRPLLEYMVDSNPNGVVIIDIESKMLYINQALANIFGYEKEEMIGQSLTMLMPQQLRKAHDTSIRRLKNTKTPSMDWKVVPLPGLHKSGNILDLELSFAAVEERPSEMIFMGIFKDVTRRNQQQRDLNDERERFQAFFEGSPEALIIHDTNGVILDANECAQDLFGQSLSELRGRKVRELHEESAAGKPPTYQLEYGQHVEFTTRMVHANGRGFPVEVQVKKIRFGDELILVAVIRDVTKIERLTNQLHRSQQMELVGRIAGGISHDFNNLLTVIIHNAHDLRTYSNLNEQDSQVVDDIITASEQASVLASRLLGMARSSKAQRVPTDLNQLIRETSRILDQMLGANIRLSVDLCEHTPETELNASQIQQVLTNLVINARDALPEGGNVTVTTRLRTGTDTSALEISVQDDGTGMSEEIQKHMFEPLFTTKDPNTGTGLGLSSVQAVLEAHGASIEVQSTLGEGSLFIIQIPIEEARPHSGPSKEDKQNRLRILVVEDMEPVRNTLVRLLNRKGFDVASAENGRKALEVLRQHKSNHFGLVITDMMMPEMNGRDLCQHIVKEFPSLRVIVLSAFSADLVPDDAKTQMIFLAKPIQPSKLYEAMTRLLGEDLFKNKNRTQP